MKVFHYSYSKNNAASGVKSTHCTDITAILNGFPAADPKDTSFGNQLISFWTNFIKYNDPNNVSSFGTQYWPEYGNNRMILSFVFRFI